MTITVKGLNALQPGRWLTDTGDRGTGNLRAKGSSRGARFYFRYRTSAGHYDDLPLGAYDPSGCDGLTLKGAVMKAGELSLRYQNGEDDLREILESERRADVRKREAEKAQAEAEAVRAQATLGALLDAYCDSLEQQGKASAKDVRASLRLHVERAHPKLWRKPADDITPDDLMDVLMTVAEARKLRMAGALRSYLRAAYAAGMAARTKASASPTLRALRIRTNPARDLGTIEGGAGQAGQRALSVDELRAYWRRIEALPDADGAALRFHLLTGAQRIKQLSRLTLRDYDADMEAVTLYDPKGRRSDPRPHVVPLIPAARDAMERMLPAVLDKAGEPTRARLGPHVFTATAGASGMWAHTLRDRLAPVVNAMLAADELPGGTFTLADLRRTVETRLAAEGVSMEIRAQLQSHGLGGVQARHYDRHDYLAEKRAALETLHRLLTGAKAGNVVPLRAKAG